MKRTSARHRASGGARQAKASTPSLRNALIYVALLAGIFAAYSQTIGHEFLNYDDPEYVTNLHLRAGVTLAGLRWAFTSGYTSNSFPLTWISHMLDFQLFGMRSGPHHISSVVLHAISTLLLFGFLNRVTGAAGRSAFVAFVFALHPLHIESVAWIAERKDVVCVVFWMLGLWAYARYAERPSAGRYAMVMVWFCCGLLSKPLMVTFPFALLLLDWWPLRRFESRPARTLIVEKIPLMILSIGASIGTFIAQQHQGALIAVHQIPVSLRIENAFLSYILYLRDFAWPLNLAVFYPYLERPLWLTIATIVGIVAASVLAAFGFRKYPYIAVGWFWYLGTLIPEIGLVQAGSQSRADRYTYLSFIGIAIIVAWGAVEVFGKRGWNLRLLGAGAAGLCITWTFLTYSNVKYWRNSTTLFAHAVEVTAANYIAYNNLGDALRQDGKIAEAAESFARVVAIMPEDAEGQDNLGEALTEEGEADEAVSHLREAVRLRPGFAKARVDLGAALLRTGHSGEAQAQYQAAIQLDPRNAAALYGLGGVLLAQRHAEEARVYFQRALPLLIAEVEMNPDEADGLYNLGALYSVLGRPDDAIGVFRQVVGLRPNDAEAHFNLATLLVSRGRYDEAVVQVQETLRIDPGHAEAGRLMEAIRLQYQK